MKYNEKRDFLFDDIINIISNKLPKDSQPLSSLDEFIKVITIFFYFYF